MTGTERELGRFSIVSARHSSRAQLLKTGGNLHLFNVNCFGVINNGDSVNFTGTYVLAPKQVITSP